MTKEEVFDINGKTPNVGDKIVIARGWTTNNAYLDISVIDEIIETQKTVTLKLHAIKTGLWGTKYADGKYLEKYNIKFPMVHCKFLIL
ncbi:hypothetical protein [uncultured Methanobrevibacter sp.]|uniref:hypothetical protein n=1 Tax=uncultured Methanobrevibacter sp. TaxID=253161 RepID=UPI0025DBDCBC|nr:hypothetical protein [uncultured Methanobrevibacter sp.]